MPAKITTAQRLLHAPPILLIAVIWLIFFTLHVLVSSISDEYAAKNIELAFTSFVGFLLSWSSYWLSQSLRKRQFRAALPLIAIFALAASTVVWATNVLLQFWIGGPFTPEHISFFWWPSEFAIRLRYGWLYFSQLFVLQAVIFALLQYARALEAQKRELVDARLAALRFQLNPHFLFNTLNAIASLVGAHQTLEAEEMIHRLSNFLRTSLSAEPTGIVSLEYELDTVQAYLEIESIRFGDRLAVRYACAPGLTDVPVPGLILQPLVENAIKYGVAPSKAVITISIEASIDGDDLILIVENDGEPSEELADVTSTGVGLRNVAARLDTLYGRAGRLEAVRRERGFTAVVRFPYEKAAIPPAA